MCRFVRPTERLTEAGIKSYQSYDNALAETINGRYKAAVIHRLGPEKPKFVELATLEWVAWFSQYRLLRSIGLTATCTIIVI